LGIAARVGLDERAQIVDEAACARHSPMMHAAFEAIRRHGGSSTA